MGEKNNCEAQSKQQNKRVVQVQGKNRKREQQQIQSSTPVEWDNKLGTPKGGHLYEKLTMPQASTIFKVRSRMLPVKNNFRNKHQTQTCRACGNCGNHTETQQHVLEECEVLRLIGEYKVYNNEINIPQQHQQPKNNSDPSWTSSTTNQHTRNEQPQQHAQHNNPVQLVPPRTRAPLPPGDVHNDDEEEDTLPILISQCCC